MAACHAAFAPSSSASDNCWAWLTNNATSCLARFAGRSSADMSARSLEGLGQQDFDERSLLETAY